MSKKFDIKNKSKLEDPKRVEILPPYKILSDLKLKKDISIADIGAGVGYFSLPIADVIGKKGIVYAIDLEIEMIEEIEKKITRNSIRNIRTIVSEEYDLKIDTNSVDVAFVSLVLHEIEDLDKFSKELQRITKDGGEIVVLEWTEEIGEFGPPIEHRVKKNDLIKIFEDNKMVVVKEEKVNDFIVSIIFKP